MIYLISILLSGFIFLISTREVHAIIVVVPAVLIPIVSIVVWVIGALTIPIVAISTLVYKTRKKSSLRGFLVGILILIILSLIITLIFKLIDPERSIY